MRKFLFSFLLVGLLLGNMAHASLVRNVQDNHQFVYTVIDSSGDFVSGQTVTLAIKRVSDGYWFDFDDSTFKASGWGNKTTALSSDATNGFYYYLFNPPASETGAEEYQFLVNNDDATYGDHQSELVSYQNIGTSTFNYSSNQVTVATNNDKTGYTASTVSDKTGYTCSTVSDKTGYSLAASQTFNMTGNITGNLSGSVGSLTTWDKSGYSLSAAGIDAIWDEIQSGHTDAGSFGKYLDAQISAISASSDPWATDVSTGYTGQAGEYLRNIKNATDGDKEGDSYTGIESMIRSNR